MIKPHARSAFRRVVSLYGGLSHLASMLDSARRSTNPESPCGPILDSLEAVVVEQIRTANDAMADWSDIVPDDVEGFRQRVQGPKRREA